MISRNDVYGNDKLSCALSGRHAEDRNIRHVLVKTVTGQSLGVLKARALPVAADGYNLLQYCWTPHNVLGDWGDRAGLTGEMVVRSLETLAWSRDLVRQLGRAIEVGFCRDGLRFVDRPAAQGRRQGHADGRSRQARLDHRTAGEQAAVEFVEVLHAH